MSIVIISILNIKCVIMWLLFATIIRMDSIRLYSVIDSVHFKRRNQTDCQHIVYHALRRRQPQYEKTLIQNENARETKEKRNKLCRLAAGHWNWLLFARHWHKHTDDGEKWSKRKPSIESLRRNKIKWTPHRLAMVKGINLLISLSPLQSLHCISRVRPIWSEYLSQCALWSDRLVAKNKIKRNCRTENVGFACLDDAKE